MSSMPSTTSTTPGDRWSRAFPWGVEAGVRSAVLTLGCGIGLIVVWWGAADRGVFSAQVGWLTAGVAVLMVSLYGHASLVIRARRAIGERRAALISDAVVTLLPNLPAKPVPESAAGNGSAQSGVIVVTGFNLFHEPGCAMAAGRDTEELSKSQALSAGLSACGICARRSVDAPTGGRPR
jgi:hypothetical protein